MSDPSFTCLVSDLRRALAFAMQPIKRRNRIPVLGNVRLTASVRGIDLRGTDLDLECAASADVLDASGQLDTTLDPRFLADLLRHADGRISVTRDGDILAITLGDMQARLREIIPAVDFPDMKRPGTVAEPFAAGAMHKAMTRTLPCVSFEETRYYLNGVYLHDASGLRAVATDGRRMAIYDTDERWPFGDMIVPRTSVGIIARALAAVGNKPVTVASEPPEHSSSSAMTILELCSGDWRITTKTIDGRFPDYTRITPDFEATGTATISAAALQRFPRGRGDMSQAIKLDMANGTMSWREPGTGEVSMPMQSTGDVEIGFNLKYLNGFARQSGVIRIEVKTSADPARVLTDDPALTQILMPMQV